MGVFSLWGPVALYMAGLFYLSSQPVLPAASLTPDWTQHGIAYGGLALVTLRATTGARWSAVGVRTVAIAWLIAAIYGVSDEFHQAFVPGRAARPLDVAIDATGALVGLLVWRRLRR